ncbi:GSCOCT00007470001.2-RA-CDS, partial [Cotesia congregata]
DPVPADSWSGVRDANKSGDVCAQKDSYSHQVIGSDDCLYLNIYTNKLNCDIPRAVLFWIHGGGFAYGHGNDYKLGPDYLVKKDVILVTFNYRLNIFGFLNLDDEESPGNQGLKDQVMALKWVKQNIANFGGDPNLVTIFGESAGSSSVHYLTLTPLAKGLFQRAIMQSGVATNPWAYTSLSMKEEAEKIADNKLGKKTSDTKELIEFLQTIEAHDLIDAVQSFVNQTNRYVNVNRFVPSVDSKSKTPFLSIPIVVQAQSGIKVPHIIGYNSDEAIILLAGLQEVDYSEINTNEDMLLPSNEKKFLQARNVSVSDVKKFFMGDKEISQKNDQLFLNLASASSFDINIHDIVAIQAKLSGIPTYFYKFDHYSKETAVVQQLVGTDLEGTSLTEDLYYFWYQKVLDDRKIKQPTSFPIEHLIQQRFFELWINFAKTG